MKPTDADPELLRFAADFIERREAVVNVEGCVLNALRHDRGGHLLEFQDEMRMLAARVLVDVLGEPQQQHVAEVIKYRCLDARIAPLGRDNRAIRASRHRYLIT